MKKSFFCILCLTKKLIIYQSNFINSLSRHGLGLTVAFSQAVVEYTIEAIEKKV